MPFLQPYWSPSYPTTSPTASLLLPSYTSPYTEYTSVHPADITPMPSTYLLPVADYQVILYSRQYFTSLPPQSCNSNTKELNRRHDICRSLLCPNTTAITRSNIHSNTNIRTQQRRTSHSLKPSLRWPTLTLLCHLSRMSRR